MRRLGMRRRGECGGWCGGGGAAGFSGKQRLSFETEGFDFN